MLLDTGLTFRDLILRVADPGMVDESGNTPQIPSDPADLERCMRFVNDGRRAFYAQMGPDAEFKRQLLEVEFSATADENTVAGDTRRQKLPWYITGGAGNSSACWSQGSTEGAELLVVHHDRIAAAWARSPSDTGAPQMVAFARGSINGTAAKHRPGYELQVDRLPDAAAASPYVVKVRVDLACVDMVQLEEAEPAGPDHDSTIIAFARFERFKNSPDAAVVASATAERDRALIASRNLELAKRPKDLGQLENGWEPVPTPRAGRTYVATFDGVEI
jgi:hypothetical protein